MSFVPILFFAENADLKSLIPLGAIDAYSIKIGQTSISGVRNLVVRNDPANDFNSVIFIWNSKKSQYQMTENRQ